MSTCKSHYRWLTMRAAALLLFPLVGLCFTTSATNAETITVEYEATAQTVTGMPFGLDVPRLTPVNGVFIYNLETPDTDPNENNGHYPHTSKGGFTALFQVGSTMMEITGSETPWYQVAVRDTLRIYDGTRTIGPEGGIMSVNGVEDESTKMFVAITPKNKDLLPIDDLPNPWPDFTFGVLGDPHTFTLEDSNGGMLLQIGRMEQVPEPTGLLLALFGALGVGGYAILRRRG